MSIKSKVKKSKRRENQNFWPKPKPKPNSTSLNRPCSSQLDVAAVIYSAGVAPHSPFYPHTHEPAHVQHTIYHAIYHAHPPTPPARRWNLEHSEQKWLL